MSGFTSEHGGSLYRAENVNLWRSPKLASKTARMDVLDTSRPSVDRYGKSPTDQARSHPRLRFLQARITRLHKGTADVPDFRTDHPYCGGTTGGGISSMGSGFCNNSSRAALLNLTPELASIRFSAHSRAADMLPSWPGLILRTSMPIFTSSAFLASTTPCRLRSNPAPLRRVRQPQSAPRA